MANMKIWTVIIPTIFISTNIVMSALKVEKVKLKRLGASVSRAVRAKARAQSQGLILGCRWVCACVSAHVYV